MDIIKFGGSSVGNVENLNKVKEIVKSRKAPFIMVVSAFSGVTNQLQQLGEKALKYQHTEELTTLRERHISMVKNLLHIDKQTNALVHIQQTFLKLETLCNSVYDLGELSQRTQARFLAQGELLSSQIIYEYLKQEDLPIQYLPSHEYIIANGDYSNAQVDFKATKERSLSIDSQLCYIAPGYVASNTANELVVLGRGGSDYTASIYAYCLQADRIELWSDVNGMQNAHPMLVKNTKVISEMSYEEAFEMAYFGAKVIYPPAIRPAMEKKIPVYLLNTLFPTDKGTKIYTLSEGRTDKVLGVTTLSDITMITVSGIGLAGTKGSARRVFQALEEANVNIILITQSCSEQNICFAIKTTDASMAQNALEKQFANEITQGQIDPLSVTHNHVILALIGDNMNHQIGLSGKVFRTLGNNGINIQAIAQGASERNISVVIDAKDEHKAVNVIHEQFFQETTKKVHLFVIGTGNVGQQFLEIVYQQQEYCKTHQKVELRVVAVANSKQFLFNPDGLTYQQVSNLSAEGTPYNAVQDLANLVINANKRNSIVVDNTASADISNLYTTFFKHSISVATCNKLAGSSTLENYNQLMALVKDKGCGFQYETTVGAALPIIKTIQNLRLSGDHINRIEAVVSGSLNFIFNHYNATLPFAQVVKRAQEEGYTEPDPRIDLNGLDVIRKLLILAREAGYQKEIKEVQFNSFLPSEAQKAISVETFYSALEENEPFFKQLYTYAEKKGAKLKVIAQLSEGALQVSLQEVLPDSPFYHLDGKDNIVALYTDMYAPEPLVVKGAGAGSKITASGVFSDVMYLANIKR